MPPHRLEARREIDRLPLKSALPFPFFPGQKTGPSWNRLFSVNGAPFDFRGSFPGGVMQAGLSAVKRTGSGGSPRGATPLKRAATALIGNSHKFFAPAATKYLPNSLFPVISPRYSSEDSTLPVHRQSPEKSGLFIKPIFYDFHARRPALLSFPRAAHGRMRAGKSQKGPGNRTGMKTHEN